MLKIKLPTACNHHELQAESHSFRKVLKNGKILLFSLVLKIKLPTACNHHELQAESHIKEKEKRKCRTFYSLVRGGSWEKRLKAIPDCVALDRHNGDICDFAKIARIVAENRPNVIINAAAFTAVDLAESEKEKAFAANFKAVQNLAEIAKKENALLVHFSTDYVFDGEKLSPYKENDAPNPQNVYGESKLAGESAILKSACDYLIFRTSWVFGDGGNFVKSILNLAQKNAELKIVADQIGCPTATKFLAEASQTAIAQALKNKEKCGLYHLTQSRALSWFEFSKEIVLKIQSSKSTV